MSDNDSIRNKIIAGVATGIILAALSQVWPPAKRLISWVWSVLVISIAVPLWVFVVGIAVLLGIAAAKRRSGRNRAEKLPAGETTDIKAARMENTAFGPLADEADCEIIDFTAVERDAIKRIAKADDAPLYMDTLKRSLGISNIRLQTALDRLTALELVEVQDDDEEEEPAVFLTAKGRQYVLENRLAR